MAPLVRGNEILDSAGAITRRTASRPSAIDVRWVGSSAGLGLAMLAGAMVQMVAADHDRVSLIWLTATVAVLAGAIGSIAMVGAHEADVLWEAGKTAAIAQGDAERAGRRADALGSDDLRSRELLHRLQVATADAMRDPFLADRLTRGPRDEQDLLSLLKQVDLHLGNLPATSPATGRDAATRASEHWNRKPNHRNP